MVQGVFKEEKLNSEQYYWFKKEPNYNCCHVMDSIKNKDYCLEMKVHSITFIYIFILSPLDILLHEKQSSII